MPKPTTPLPPGEQVLTKLPEEERKRFQQFVHGMGTEIGLNHRAIVEGVLSGTPELISRSEYLPSYLAATKRHSRAHKPEWEQRILIATQDLDITPEERKDLCGYLWELVIDRAAEVSEIPDKQAQRLVEGEERPRFADREAQRKREARLTENSRGSSNH